MPCLKHDALSLSDILSADDNVYTGYSEKKEPGKETFVPKSKFNF